MHVHLVIRVQKRRTLSILLPLLASRNTNLLSKDTWDDHNKGSQEKDTHNDKGKDPLEGNCLAEELADTEGGGEDGECEAHGVVLGFVSSLLSDRCEAGSEEEDGKRKEGRTPKVARKKSP